MTQILRAPTIVNDFAGSNILIAIFLDRAGGGLIRESEIPMQELWLKMGGGLIREGGRISGILWYNFLHMYMFVLFNCMKTQYNNYAGTAMLHFLLIL